MISTMHTQEISYKIEVQCNIYVTKNKMGTPIMHNRVGWWNLNNCD